MRHSQNEVKSLRQKLSAIMSAAVIANGAAILSDMVAASYALGIIFGITSLVQCWVVYRFPLVDEKPRSRRLYIGALLIFGTLSIIGSINNFVHHL